MASKITMIEGESTPEVFCAKLMELSDEIVNIACVVQFKNDTLVFSNAMSNGNITWLRWVFDQNFRPEIKGER